MALRTHRSRTRFLALLAVAALAGMTLFTWLALLGFERLKLRAFERREAGLLGAVFGAAKGVLIITLAVLVCSFTDLPQTPDWRQSFSAVYFEALAQLAVPYLPPVVADQVQYPTL